jgi:ribonucleotide reductase beta subunit family protein with ferritin-like domain
MTDNILFKEDEGRYTIFPIKDNKIWEFYKNSVSVFWTPEEIDMGGDYTDFMKMTENERYFIKMILSFFASADGVVNENLVNRFSSEVQLSEARAVYSIQNFIETIHGETYSLLIDTYIKNKEEKLKCFNAIQEFDCIREKCMWGQKWITDKESSFAIRLLAFIMVEGLFFSGSFCAIFWLKKRGLMKGLTFSNELISRDEGLHTEFGIYLYNTYCDKIDKDDFYKMIKEAVEIETKFICEALPVRLIGMNSELMTIYIKFVADRLCAQLNYDKIYNVENPFAFMEMISVEAKTNFFEKRVSEYSLSNGGNRNNAFDFNSDTLF